MNKLHTHTESTPVIPLLEKFANAAVPELLQRKSLNNYCMVCLKNPRKHRIYCRGCYSELREQLLADTASTSGTSYEEKGSAVSATLSGAITALSSEPEIPVYKPREDNLELSECQLLRAENAALKHELGGIRESYDRKVQDEFLRYSKKQHEMEEWFAEHCRELEAQVALQRQAYETAIVELQKLQTNASSQETAILHEKLRANEEMLQKLEKQAAAKKKESAQRSKLAKIERLHSGKPSGGSKRSSRGAGKR